MAERLCTCFVNKTRWVRLPPVALEERPGSIPGINWRIAGDSRKCGFDSRLELSGSCSVMAARPSYATEVLMVARDPRKIED